MEEIWKAIPNFEGIYEASNLGNVKRLVGYRCRKERILRQKTSKIGYKSIQLFKNGKENDLLVHRIIAETFILNPNNKRTVNHKNGIKIDNRIENLEWCSYRENHKHAYDILGRINPKGMQGKKNKQKIVQQYDINGMLINEYKNVLEASRITTVKFHSIYACCHNKCKTGYGFIWKYKVE